MGRKMLEFMEKIKGQRTAAFVGNYGALRRTEGRSQRSEVGGQQKPDARGQTSEDR
jgi:hypothetical protein